MFKLLPILDQKVHITDLSLCAVLLEDNSYFPWVLLVPKRENVKNMMWLSFEERLELMREIAIVEEAMASLFQPEQTNVAMIGNKVMQLHVHIICRNSRDVMWPETVWGRASKPYTLKAKVNIVNKIREEILVQKERFEKKGW